MNKTDNHKSITTSILRCKICNANKVGKLVPGEGNPKANVMFVGEAPGKKEAETGRPFVGRSGKLLRTLIVQAGLKEKDVFITSALKYLPAHVTPKPGEIDHGRKHLFKQIEAINPKIIVLLGRFAVLSVLKKNVSIAKEHGKIIEQDGRTYLIAYHPAAALYTNAVSAKLKADFLKLKWLI